MAPRRGTSSDLVKLLETSAAAVYALDGERRIVLVNAACRAWLAAQPGELTGVQCCFHSEPSEHGDIPLAAMLCPPPTVFAGRRAVATVGPSPAAPEQPARWFDFIPLSGTGGLLGAGSTVELVLAIEQPAHEDSGSGPTEIVARESTPQDLHAALVRMRVMQKQRYQEDRLLGTSPAMRCARAQAGLAAQSLATVVVIGRPGSGRQHAAKAIHYARPLDALGPLVPLACGVLGAEMLQTSIRALARPKAGATGRVATLLLNDVDQMPAEAQNELAGFLRLSDLPVRIVSTARQALAEAAGPRGFRPDLAVLLSTITIELVPLAERLEDLPLVAQAFLERENARATKQLGGFSPEALDMLSGYGWPGDVDELAQLVAEAHRQAPGPLVTVADLPQKLSLARDAQRYAKKPEERIVLETFMGQIERELIERALRRARGNKTKAARLLGMTRPRLYRRLVQLGLEGSDE